MPALTLAQEFYPGLDVEAYSRQIDQLASKVWWLAKNTTDPEQRIRALNSVLFRNEGFHYDRRPDARSRQDYYFLNGILDTKQGICYTLPLLYVAIAQRLGYPIYPVAAPDHMFVRYADPAFKEQNIETTSGGKYIPDATYIKDFFVSEAGIRSGSYLKTLSYREFAGHILASNAVFHGKNGNIQATIAYLEKAVQLAPTFADNYDNLARSYLAYSQIVGAEQAALYREKARQYAEKAKELGLVGAEDVALGRKIRGQMP